MEDSLETYDPSDWEGGAPSILATFSHGDRALDEALAPTAGALCSSLKVACICLVLQECSYFTFLRSAGSGLNGPHAFSPCPGSMCLYGDLAPSPWVP
jgi:hypothetical protein